MGKRKSQKGDTKTSSKETENSVDEKTQSRASKKIDIYKKALKRTITSGTDNIFNDPVLKELRHTLEISEKEHNKLTEMITAEISSMEQIVKESKQKISKIEKQVSDFKKKNIDTKIIENLLARAREARNEKSYTEFDTYIDESSRIIKDQQRNYKIYHKMDNIEKNIQAAEKMGANVKKLNEILKNAKAAKANNDFKTATKLTTIVSKQSIELRKFGTAQKQVKQFQIKLNQAKKVFDVKNCQALIVQANKYLKDNNYKKVASTIIEAKKLLEESKRHNTAMEKVNKIHEIIQLDEEAGIEVKQIKPLVEKLEKHLEAKDYNEITKQSSIIRKELEEVRKFKNANDKIAEAQEEIQRAKDVGSTVKTAARLVSQAKTALKKKKYQNVHKNARSAIKIAKEGRITALRRKASSAISSARFLIKEVKDFGADVSEAEKLLSQADKELSSKNFEEAQTLAEEAEHSAKGKFEKEKKKYLKKGIKESLANIDFIFNEMDDMKIDFTTIKEKYELGQQKFEDGEYEIAEKLIKESEEIARKTLEDAKHQQRKENAKKEMEDCRNLLDEAKQMDIDVSAAENSLMKAEKLFEEERYEDVIDKGNDLKEMVNLIKNEKLKSRTQEQINST
jgi:hypothetical protein